MSPLLAIPLAAFSRSSHPDFSAAGRQWINPTDVLTVLMIIGGDIVQRALASMAGSRHKFAFAPVAFSFGWVSYSFSAILASAGAHRLLPVPDYDCMLVNAYTGYARQNRSFALARLVRDCEPTKQGKKGLAIEFYKTVHSPDTGYLDVDWVYVFSILVIVAQLILSVIPIIIHQHYIIFILTLGGTILALLTAALPQWREEKWGAARPVSERVQSVVCLTPGNGAHAVIVIVSEGCGLRLEDLAAGRHDHSSWTNVVVVAFAVLWIVHLNTVQGLTTDSWFSLGIGALGMVQNAVAAGAKRPCGALGFHLEYDEEKSLDDDNVFKALQRAEEVEPYVGLALLPIFFPGKLRIYEVDWRNKRRAELAAKLEHPFANANDEAMQDDTSTQESPPTRTRFHLADPTSLSPRTNDYLLVELEGHRTGESTAPGSVS